MGLATSRDAVGNCPRRLESLAQIWEIVADLMSDLGDQSDSGIDAEIWFRGHAQSTYQLVPSLLRSPKTLTFERQLFTSYRSLHPDMGHWESLFAMQHHAIPTRLLDWTTDLATALYFALNSEVLTFPSIYLLSPSILNSCSGLGTQPLDITTDEASKYHYPEHYGFSHPQDGAITWGHQKPLALVPPRRDARIRAQGGRFTVHGQIASSIEVQCPSAIRKIEIVVPRREIEQFRRLGRKLCDVFPDDEGMANWLRHQYSAYRNPKQVIEETLANIWRKVDGNEGLESIHGAAGCMVGGLYIERICLSKSGHDLASWFGAGDQPFAIVTGGAGSGKTNFLFAAVLKDRRYGTRPVLFYSLGAFRRTDRSLIGSLVQYLADQSPSLGSEAATIDESTLETMIRDGDVLLILDGLDELARNQGESTVHYVIVELGRLAKNSHPKVLLAGRDHIVDRLITHDVLPQWEQFSLAPIPTPVLKKALYAAAPNIHLSKAVLKLVSEVPLFYGLLIRFALQARKVGKVVSISINGRAGLWDVWLKMAEGNQRHASTRMTLLARLGEVAVLMLRERSDYLTSKQLEDNADIAGFVQSFTLGPSAECPVFVSETIGSRFIHQAFREYVFASNIAHGLRHPEESSILTSSGSLDYESAETYIYLRDLLQGRRVDPAWLDNDKPSHPVSWNNFARNFFEALGMLGVDKERYEEAINTALRYIGSDWPVRFQTRYNAARCLARLHPTSSDPYCAWAVKRNSPQFQPEGCISVYGYAVRGFHQKRLRTGIEPPEDIFGKFEYGKVTRQVCPVLLAQIEQLASAGELHEHGEFLQINCSHALIRWLDCDSKDGIARALALLRSKLVHLEARMNLLLALEVHKRSPNPERRAVVRKPARTIRIDRSVFNSLFGGPFDHG